MVQLRRAGQRQHGRQAARSAQSRDSDALGAIVVTIPDSTDDPSAVDLPDFIQYVDNLRTGLNTDKLKMTVRLLPSYANFKGNGVLRSDIRAVCAELHEGAGAGLYPVCL